MSFSLDTADKQRSPAPTTRAGRRIVRVGMFAAALLAGFGVFAGWLFLGNENRAAGQGPRTQPSVSVVATAAEKGDINVYITGLGTVTALYTATIHTRVDGQVMKVPFKEGDIVKKDALRWRSTRGRSRRPCSRPRASWRGQGAACRSQTGLEAVRHSCQAGFDSTADKR